MSSAAPAHTALAQRLCATALEAGLDHVGVCDAEPFDETRVELERRRDLGLSAGMQFTYRNPARSTDPSRALPGARSMLVGALGYASQVPPSPPGPHGRVARYATHDHYAVLRRALEAVAAQLVAEGHRARVLVDDNALVDRAAAVRAGVGWYGRSANVLVPGHGSWFVLGSVLTDAELGSRPPAVADGCGSCTRCIDGCPTGAIVAPGVVDARRCLAWLVQADGDLPHEFRVALDDRVYGCDDCQEVCPPSRREEQRRPTVHVRGEGADDSAPSAWVELQWMLGADDDELLARLGRWYVPRRDPRYLRRNALVALGNSVATRHPGARRDPEVESLLVRYLRSDDDLLVGHAAWAALRMERADLLDEPTVATHAAVRAELERWLRPVSGGEDGAP